MKIRQLMRELARLPQDAELAFCDQKDGALRPIHVVHEYEDGSSQCVVLRASWPRPVHNKPVHVDIVPLAYRRGMRQ